MSWFYLALLAPLLYAIVNLLDDNLLRFVYKGPYLAAAASGIFGALPLLSLFFVDPTPIPISLASIMVAAGFMTSLYYFLYFKSLAIESPSVVVAILGLVPAIVPILAYYFLGEKLVGAQLAGFVIVLLASMVLALTDVKKLKLSAAFFPLMGVVLLLSAISIMTKYVYDRTEFYSAFMYMSFGVGLGGIYLAFIMYFDDRAHDLSVFKRGLHKLFLIFIVVELLAVAAEFTSNLAISKGSVSLVRVIESIQPIFVLLIAMAFYPLAPKYFREAAMGHRSRKIVLMCLVIIGLTLINFASR